MGNAITITRSDSTADELRTAIAKSRAGAKVRQLFALAFILDGYTRTDAAKQSGMERQTLRDWVHRYNQKGLDALTCGHGPGQPPSLTAAQMAELKALVLNGPAPEKHGVVCSRCAYLRPEISRRYKGASHDLSKTAR